MGGWTVGGGYEWMFNPNTTVFVEAKYFDVGPKTFVLDDPEQVHVRSTVIKAGVNWKLGTNPWGYTGR